MTGAARYPSDAEVRNPVWAFLVTSAIARGRIAAMDEAAARAVPGVLDILSHRNMHGAVREAGFFAAGGYAGNDHAAAGERPDLA